MTETINGDKIPMPEDGDPKCAVVVLLDNSGSMDGEPIAQLNAGLTTFWQALQDDPLAARRCEVAIITFGGSVRVTQDFVSASNVPQLAALAASGQTPMGAAIVRAVEMVSQRKEQYRASGVAQYRPWIFMLTDGQPTDDVSAVIPRVHQGDAAKSFLFFAVGCYGADMQMLKAIAPPSTPPAYLQGADFQAMFKWLSDSLGRVSSSTVGQQVALPANNWGTITT